MLKLGLTGTIASGKSTTAAMFGRAGAAIFSGDDAVHALYRGAAAPLVEAAFPRTTENGEVNRARLGEIMRRDTVALKTLEAIVHPMVREAERQFLRAEAARGASMAVLEIPLLLEGGAHSRVDVVVVVSAPPEMQRQRVLARPGMSLEKLEQILGRQLHDSEKRARADFIVDTGGTIAESAAQVDKIVESLQGRPGEAYAKHWA